ncbi:MAG: cobalamin biosynthesis protein CobQ [Patescibacteria group bacterium]
MKNRQSSIVNRQYYITIGWLYPELMSTYGDRGNIICLAKRCEWRKIGVQAINLNEGFSPKLLNGVDILFMGGAQDTQQGIVSKDFTSRKIEALKSKIEGGTPGLYICGAYQFLGKYYKEADGNKIKGLDIFDLYTEHPGVGKERLIGNIAIKTSDGSVVVGFENHGGRTYLGKNLKPFGQVIKGYGNNSIDGTEGAIYKNSIGTYLHGPILPKNPLLADYLIKTALKVKYGKDLELEKLDDSLEEKARMAIAKRLQIAI